MGPAGPAKPFDESRCDRCGLCFSECPVMDLPVKTAREEIARLIAGQPTRHVLCECTSCFACDHLCPRGCNPAELVLQRWHEQYLAEGLPLRARYYTGLAGARLPGRHAAPPGAVDLLPAQVPRARDPRAARAAARGAAVVIGRRAARQEVRGR